MQQIHTDFTDLGGLLPSDMSVEVYFHPLNKMWVAHFSNGHTISELWPDDLKQSALEYIAAITYGCYESDEMYGEPVRQAYEPEPEGDES